MTRTHALTTAFTSLALTGTLVLTAPMAALDAHVAHTSASYDSIVLPSGTLLPLTLETRVSSATSRVEDPVRARLRHAVTVGNRVVLPAGTPVSGIVVDADRSGRVKGRALIALRFTSLVLDGRRYAIRTSAVVRRAPGTKKRDAATIAIPAGAGAVVGGLLDGRSGAAKGAAIGGAGGTGVVLATRGREVMLPPGAAIGVRLTRSLALDRE
jgi:hypothetical protein